MLFVIAGGAGGYWYVQKLQADLKISEANNAKLESAVGEQQALVEQMKKDFAKIQKINTELEESNNKLKFVKEEGLLNEARRQTDRGLRAWRFLYC